MSRRLFGLDRCALIGMVHLGALPGSPRWGGSMAALEERAIADARSLAAGGCDALIVENMHDLPYLKGRVEPETVAAMALLTAAVVDVGIPTGAQVLAGANREALGIALASGASFIRAEAFAYAHVADEGWLDASAGPLLRARAAMGADHISVWADIRKKHAAHTVTSDLSLAEIARGTAFTGADALIVTGTETGCATNPADVDAAAVAGLPVAVGSGVTPDNARHLADRADALIVGSWLKIDGDWREPVDPARVARLAAIVQS